MTKIELPSGPAFLRSWRGMSIAFLAVTIATPALSQPRAVLELFTSQGCSSCPPADRMLTKWSQDSSLIALSLPIDYWDYLGWKDTLASHAFSLRQHDYSEARGDRAVYTPQLVVDGVAHAVGSNGEEVNRAINAAGAMADVLTVPVAISGHKGTYSISLGKSSSKGEVWVVPIESAAQVAISRGENIGKTVTYSNVVRGFHKVADYNGNAATLALKADDTQGPGADSFAVLVQVNAHGKPGPILGAAFQRP